MPALELTPACVCDKVISAPMSEGRIVIKGTDPALPRDAFLGISERMRPA